jgi:proteasome lid subunit RPN8/RPN11
MDLVMEINLFKNSKNALNKIKDHCILNPFAEICGFLGYDSTSRKYIVQLEKNNSPDPKNFFSIDPLNYLIFKQKYILAAVFHSHIIGDERPSEFDIKTSENCCVPFLIYGLNTDGFSIYRPKSIEYDAKVLKRIKSNI